MKTRTQSNFERLVLPHRDMLYGQALSLTRNADEAEDLVQETTLRALRGFETLRSEGPLKSWLLTILRNLFINSYRAKRRAPVGVSLDALENPDPFVPTEASPERGVVSRMESEAVNRAVANLPDDYREVLEMSDMRGLSYQEISETMELPIGTVRSRLSRARSRVRRALFAWRPEAQGSSKMASPPVEITEPIRRRACGNRLPA
ncbi:MAG: sigma-70 family RNA polymerase sigma factor [Armatimonadetes bacterium]|nr:sigma-70 family RNA polymerase sigma factor [Armatimonadota bacterium]